LGQGGDLLRDPTLAAIAQAHGKTPAQIVLRWNIELGLVPIPRSSDPVRLAQNLDVFDFGLTPTEIVAITALDTGAEKSASIRTCKAIDRSAIPPWRFTSRPIRFFHKKCERGVQYRE
jgi:2,5-diketo-D-gluconate reductase A